MVLAQSQDCSHCLVSGVLDMLNFYVWKGRLIMKNDGKRFFSVLVDKYVKEKNFRVFWPASINAPRDNSVMFLMEKKQDSAEIFTRVKNCLIFWPEKLEVPEEVRKYHAIVRVKEPRLEYCRFFKDNGIQNLPRKEKFKIREGACICEGAVVPDDCIVMSGAYISGESRLGKSCYIGSGVKLVGRVEIGNNVIIRENTVIGADGLSTDRDVDGKAITMPQFGGVHIDDNVEIGANAVIARGAIDDTILQAGCKIDNSSFISHNVFIGNDSFIVGETIVFGSARIGERVFISGNSTIRNKAVIGDDVQIGMGAVVTKDINAGLTAFGNPAKIK